MRKFADALHGIVLTFWVGGLWAIGYLVAPTLFSTLSDRQLAGLVAGKLFSLIGWVGIGSAVYLLLFALLRSGAGALRRLSFWVVVAMLGLTLVGQFGIQPLLAHLKAEAWPRDVMGSVMRDRFAAWHGISSILYLIESVLGLLLVTLPAAKAGR